MLVFILSAPVVLLSNLFVFVLQNLVLVFFTILAALAAVCDLKFKKIPNWLCIALFALAFLKGFSLFWLVLPIAFAFALYAAGAWAGGDAKLFMALSAYSLSFNAWLWLYAFLLAVVGVLVVGWKSGRSVAVKDLRQGMVLKNALVDCGGGLVEGGGLVGGSREIVELNLFWWFLGKARGCRVVVWPRAAGLSALELKELKRFNRFDRVVVRNPVVFAPFLSTAFVVVSWLSAVK